MRNLHAGRIVNHYWMMSLMAMIGGNCHILLVAQPLIDYRLYSNMVAQKRVHWKKSLKLFSLVSFFNVHGSEVLGGKMREPKSIGMKSEKEMSTVIHKTFVRWIEHNEALWVFMNQATWLFICLHVYSLQLTISDQFGIWLNHHTLNRQNLICFKFGNWSMKSAMALDLQH